MRLAPLFCGVGVIASFWIASQTSFLVGLLVVLASIGLWLHSLVPTGRQGFKDAKAVVPGNLVRLSLGNTHYKLLGPEGGELCVLVHGLSGDCTNWKHLVPSLTSKGYRVLCMDLYGRGFSESDDSAPMNVNMFVSQLRELVHHVTKRGQDPVFNLLGWSMGGAIVAKYAECYPDQVRRLCLVCPAGLPVNKPAILKVLKVPLLRNLMMLAAKNQILADTRKSFANISPPNTDDMLKEIVANKHMFFAQNTGYARSLLKTLVEFDFDGLSPTFEAIGEHKRVTHILWGDIDTTCPSSNIPVIKKLMPAAEVVTIRQGRHSFPVQRHSEFADHVLRWLSA